MYEKALSALRDDPYNSDKLNVLLTLISMTTDNVQRGDGYLQLAKLMYENESLFVFDFTERALIADGLSKGIISFAKDLLGKFKVEQNVSDDSKTLENLKRVDQKAIVRPVVKTVEVSAAILEVAPVVIEVAKPVIPKEISSSTPQGNSFHSLAPFSGFGKDSSTVIGYSLFKSMLLQSQVSMDNLKDSVGFADSVFGMVYFVLFLKSALRITPYETTLCLESIVNFARETPHLGELNEKIDELFAQSSGMSALKNKVNL